MIVPAALSDGGRVAYSTLEEVLAALATEGPAVLCTDGLEPEWLEPVAAAIQQRRTPVVEVRSARWDGVSRSPVSAACRGVVSGFGVDGLAAAAAALAEGPIQASSARS